MGNRTVEEAVRVGDPDCIFVAKDAGERCSIVIPRPRNREEAGKLVQAVALLVTGAAETLSKCEDSCGHVACTMTVLKVAIMQEFDETFPDAEGGRPDAPLH